MSICRSFSPPCDSPHFTPVSRSYFTRSLRSEAEWIGRRLREVNRGDWKLMPRDLSPITRSFRLSDRRERRVTGQSTEGNVMGGNGHSYLPSLTSLVCQSLAYRSVPSRHFFPGRVLSSPLHLASRHSTPLVPRSVPCRSRME